MGVFQQIPTCLTVCMLVMIFACLKRHTRCARLTLWAVGWTLAFTHFLARLLEPAGGYARPLLLAIDSGSLQASAVAFLVSVSSVAENRAKRTLLLSALAVPSVTYAVLDAYTVGSRWPYILCLLACFGSAACFLFSVKRELSFYVVAVTLLCSFAGAWVTQFTLNSSFHAGTLVLLGLGFSLPGLLIFRGYWPKSPALLTISGGFFCWGAVFFMPLLLDRFSRNMILPDTLSDTPKLVVAFGMILAVVEYKSEAIVGMQLKAKMLNRQLERFSAITSRLLGSEAPDAICPDIASAITEVSSFTAAVIHIESQEGTLRMVGSSGLPGSLPRRLQDRTEDWTASHFQSLCSHARRIGKASFLLPPGESAWPVGAGNKSETSHVRPGARIELLIPLCSAAGACVGGITLAAPCDEDEIPIQELARIESLATDLAVAVELKSLHSQLVWSEKLAAIGQLVAGVAHELNNPLTAIMGFGELMTDAVTSARTRDHLARLLSETRRMKRITENLLRFSRQSSWDSHVARLSPVVQEVLMLCEYYTRHSKVGVEIEIAPDLPPMAINEDEIKQVLLNLFNNSCDALQGFSGIRKISIRAFRAGAHVLVQVEDTGPGFSNLDRALDPFYTTKPVGKGTGLGLSVCYRIAKKRGGDLWIENVKPNGGRVTLQVPVIEPRELSQPLRVASAHA
jgi:two-component system, NtrC family, sensor kinase